MNIKEEIGKIKLPQKISLSFDWVIDNKAYHKSYTLDVYRLEVVQEDGNLFLDLDSELKGTWRLNIFSPEFKKLENGFQLTKENRLVFKNSKEFSILAVSVK